MIRIFFFLSVLLLSTSARAQTIDRDSVGRVLHRISASMEIYHPAPYHYRDSTELATLREQLIAELPAEVDTLQLYRTLDRYVCAYNDAHTRVYGGAALHHSKQNSRVLPFDLTISGDSLSILRDYRTAAAEDRTGQVITHLNGLPVASVLTAMSRHAHRETARLDLAVLKRNFAYYHWLTYGDTSYELTLVDGTRLRAEGISLNELYERRPEQSTPPIMDLSYPEDGVVLLTIRDFNASPRYFKKRFREIFGEIRQSGATKLILDLRGHDGGDSRVGVELARYFSPVEFQPFAYSEWRVTPAFRRAFKATYLPGVLSKVAPLIRGFNPHLRAIYGAENHTNARVEYPVAKPYGSGRRFAGEVVLLMDEHTFSAGTCFAAMFRDYDMGTIIGRESGNLASFHADALLRLPLPHGMVMRISTSYLVRPSGDETMAPVQPDVRVAGDILGAVLRGDFSGKK